MSLVRLQAEILTILTEVFRGFLSSYGQIPEYYLQFGHNSFLPYPFQFIADYYPIIRTYVVLVTDSVFK
jgi:hypothetical protein